MKRKDVLFNALLIGGTFYFLKQMLDAQVISAGNEFGKKFDEGGSAYAGAKTVTVGPDGTTSR